MLIIYSQQLEFLLKDSFKRIITTDTEMSELEGEGEGVNLRENGLSNSFCHLMNACSYPSKSPNVSYSIAKIR